MNGGPHTPLTPPDAKPASIPLDVNGWAEQLASGTMVYIEIKGTRLEVSDLLSDDTLDDIAADLDRVPPEEPDHE